MASERPFLLALVAGSIRNESPDVRGCLKLLHMTAHVWHDFAGWECKGRCSKIDSDHSDVGKD